MTTLPTIKTVDRPTNPVRREPTPFDELWPVNEGQALSFVLPSKTDDEKKEVEKVVKLAQRSGGDFRSDAHPNGLTVRKRLVPEDDGKTTRVYLWSTDKVKHKPKNEADDKANKQGEDASATTAKKATTSSRK